MRQSAVTLLLAACLVAGHATEWVHDDHLTLSLNTCLTRGDGEPAVLVQASAYLSPLTVERWTEESSRAQTLEGAPNPRYGRSRGYRVSISVTREGEPVVPWRTRAGTGPLADWVGVFATRVGNQVVWKRCNAVQVSFRVPLRGDTAEYRVVWRVDSKPVRSEVLRLPGAWNQRPSTDSGGLRSDNGVGTYPPGTQIGAPYPFSIWHEEPGALVTGEGVIVAALSPAQARQACGLDRDPSQPVLVGWQPDCEHALSLFFAESEASELTSVPAAPLLAPVGDLPADVPVEATDGPTSFFVRMDPAGKVCGTISLAPGARAQRLRAREVMLERGLARVSLLEGSLAVVTPQGAMTVDGLALVDVQPDTVQVWCLSGQVTLGEQAIRSQQRATWAADAPQVATFSLADLAAPFLRTCFVLAPDTEPEPRPVESLPAGTVHAVLCLGLDEEGQPRGMASRFPADTPALTLLVEHNFPDDQARQLGISLLFGDTARYQYRVQVTGEGRFTLQFRPGGGRFQPGAWRVRLEHAGKLDQEIAFTITE